ncbi:iron ABC transporter permease [Streptomyces inusitatus]|uniref:Iron ABC transporter permease n=1 Tax=Streptomyces inusitatus TaxID=68221 RepID=A0A918V3R4_9ACTN|nr:iron chelate uptake ABC transporter family permease subunit [Streptomyces inusitatus]GGZ60176.1 iron ABC transporter permease [Streptomyces inusitatus]
MATVPSRDSATAPRSPKDAPGPRKTIGAPRPPGPAGPSAVRRGAAIRLTGLLVACAVLLLMIVLSISLGAKSIPFGDVVEGLLHPDGSENAVIVQDYRLTRTLLGIVVGIGLGLSGAVMQALTRNPLADPGLLGIESGASAAVVVAIGGFGITSLLGYVWFAFAGAVVVAVVVYILGASGRGAAGPVRLVLAGTAVNASLIAGITAVTFLDDEAFGELRMWAVGTLAGREGAVLGQVAPFLIAGALIALSLSGSLNALALGDEAGKALGARVVRTRVLGVLSVTLLCGAATAAIGPVGFVGLIVPHVARLITGPDHRWILAHCVVLAPVLLLGADVLGRLVVRPDELAVGIVTAAIGAPVLVALVRTRKVPQL